MKNLKTMFIKTKYYFNKNMKKMHLLMKKIQV